MLTLHFGDRNTVQSVVKVGCPAHLELAYAQIVPSCLGFVEKRERVLIVGLGGGTLPMFFHSQFPDLRIDAVEIDPAVHQIATTHCGFREDERLRVHIEDGRDFIELIGEPYDLIVLDSFGNDSIPRIS
jgi:spermidine synthase